MKSMTIGKKLFMSFGAALALTLGLAYSSLRSLGHLSAALDTALNQTAHGAEIAGQMDTSAAYLRTGQRGVILYSILKEPAMVEKSQVLFTSHAARIDKLATGIERLVRSDEARRAADTIRSSVNDWQPLYQEVVKMSTAGRFNEINPVVERTIAIADRIQAACERIAQAQREDLAEAAKEGAATSASSRWIVWILVSASLGVGGLVLWLVRQVSRSLRQVVGELSAGADQTSSAARQVSSSSQSLAQGASEHAAALEETSASVEEINSMASRNSENSTAAANLVTRSQEKFVETNRSLEQMELAMDEIHASSDKISKIIKVIDEIAFQTNILALNAAVEAARAGDAGMGFAVVADEVRNLAQRSAQAAKDTAALIEESIAKSNEGKTKVDEVAVAIRVVTGESAQIKNLVEQVNLGSKEQARGIDQISKAIVQMQNVTQATAASAEESAAAAEELTGQSKTLKAVVERLTGMVGGETGGGLGKLISTRGAAPVQSGAAHYTASAPQD